MWLRLLVVAIFSFLTSAYELGGLMSGNSMASVPLGVSLGDGELDVEGVCQRSGPTCQNCTHSVTCIALPVGWLKVPLDACPEEMTCNARRGGCSVIPVPECDSVTMDYKHKCEQVGIFPDAYDCRKFHLCSPPVDMPFARPADHRAAYCPRHYAYNPYTAQCSIKLPYAQCESKPVPECTDVGQTDALPHSPNHYYVCLSKYGNIYPQVFVCPHGWFFRSGFCNPEPNPPQTDANIGRKSEDEAKERDRQPTEQATEVSKVNTVTASVPVVRLTEYPPDTFLADKFDLTHYETIDDPVTSPQASYEFGSSSFESF